LQQSRTTNTTNPKHLRRWAIAIGSNLADPPGAVALAWRAVVALLDLQSPSVSRCWTTEPAEQAHGPLFANAVGCGWTTRSAGDGLATLQRIERAFGRDRDREGFHGPRPLDLDLIAIEDDWIDLPALTVPHPRWHQRIFVAGPLAEIWPDLAGPEGRSAAAWAALLGAGGETAP
jgi:2-amino-4-hydroxy-6-hydroxymethyldihydropteridine diphosphokinase